MDDDSMKAFMDVVRKIPPTWTCVRCHHEFDNSPSGEMSAALEVREDGRGNRRIVGEICKDCYAK